MRLLERARYLRSLIEKMAKELDDEEALNGKELFPEWKVEEAYSAGDRVRHNDILYKCLQAHTSQESWTPDTAVSLWTRVLIPDPEVIPEWEQPDSTNPYMKGDKVRHDSKIWVSDVDNNVWVPGVYGWSEVGE